MQSGIKSFPRDHWEKTAERSQRFQPVGTAAAAAKSGTFGHSQVLLQFRLDFLQSEQIGYLLHPCFPPLPLPHNFFTSALCLFLLPCPPILSPPHPTSLPFFPLIWSPHIEVPLAPTQILWQWHLDAITSFALLACSRHPVPRYLQG